MSHRDWFLPPSDFLAAKYNSAQGALAEVGPNIRRFEVKDQKEKEDQEMLDANTEAIESRTELYRLILPKGSPMLSLHLNLVGAAFSFSYGMVDDNFTT